MTVAGRSADWERLRDRCRARRVGECRVGKVVMILEEALAGRFQSPILCVWSLDFLFDTTTKTLTVRKPDLKVAEDFEVTFDSTTVGL